METATAAEQIHGTSSLNSCWNGSDTLFLLNCYDVWSATPPRGCQCGDPIPAPEADD